MPAAELTQDDLAILRGILSWQRSFKVHGPGVKMLNTRDTCSVHVAGERREFRKPVGGFWAKISGNAPTDPGDTGTPGAPFHYGWIRQVDHYDEDIEDVVFQDQGGENPSQGTTDDGYALNSWETGPDATSKMTPLGDGTIVWMHVTHDDQVPPEPVYRFMFPTIGGCP